MLYLGWSWRNRRSDLGGHHVSMEHVFRMSGTITYNDYVMEKSNATELINGTFFFLGAASDGSRSSGDVQTSPPIRLLIFPQKTLDPRPLCYPSKVNSRLGRKGVEIEGWWMA
jgi:hypothetical protein